MKWNPGECFCYFFKKYKSFSHKSCQKRYTTGVEEVWLVLHENLSGIKAAVLKEYKKMLTFNVNMRIKGKQRFCLNIVTETEISCKSSTLKWIKNPIIH